MKNQKGINLVSLSVAVIVIIAIAGTVLYNVRTNLGVQKLKAMQTDIENLRGKVANYYLQYGALPTLNVYSGGEKQDTSIPKDSNVIKDVVENATSDDLDAGDYYVIDLSAMENITLTYGEDYENLKDKSAETIKTLGNGTLTDVYIINAVSHNIFYVAGITYEGKTYYTQYQDEESNKTGSVDIDLNGEFENKDGKIIHRVYPGDSAPKNKEAFYIDGEYKAVIPPGFTVSNVKEISETTGEVIKDETSIENGLVVKDEKENEWVWIPVSDNDFSLMFGTASDDGWTMLETSIKSKYKSLGTTLGNRTLIRTNPGTTTDPYYREPDVLSSFDIDENNRKQAGFVEKDGTTASSLETMAIKLKNDYKDMMDSVKENKGFYIGRYELGKDTSDNDKPQVKEGDVMNYINWYELYSACKSFSSGDVQSRMVWGCQWDQVCRFISTLGENKVSSLDDSTNYGNYSGSTDYKTGTRNNCITNNIYDLAGNCWEWTQEAYYINCRTERGRWL